MKKLFSLIKASMTEGMNIFKISTKKKNTFTKIGLPILITIILMGAMGVYSNNLMEQLAPINMHFVVLTLFIVLTSIITLIEGIYKSGNLLFNCKDDNMLLSFPIKKSTVLFIRIFKFYIFELLYNSVFLLPSMIVYAVYVKPEAIYYTISFISLLIFPIVPILISCIIGTIITFFASKFKGKNYIQTIITIAFLIGVMFVSYNSDSILANLAKNAANINDFITKLYYPAGAYIELITKYNTIKLLEFILIHIGLFVITILLISRIYFNINSSMKSVKSKKSTGKYKIKSMTPMRALIKKEFSRFINSPVFVSNAGLGLVLFIIGCIFLTFKYDSTIESIANSNPMMNLDAFKNSLPIIFIGFICVTSFMTSITSSMISLEGKSFSILKSLPIRPYNIIKSKVLTALIIMLPCMLVGDIIIFIKFKFDFLNIVLTLIASVLFPLISATIGIIVNLKYPRMDAKNDTEVVKQSLSSTVSVFIGMILIAVTVALLYKAFVAGISKNLIIFILLGVYLVIYLGLEVYLHKTGDKNFENIVI